MESFVSGINGVDSKGSGTYRAALAAVIILSVLLVLAVIAVVVGFVRQYRIYSAGRQPAAGVARPGDLPATILLKPGAHIVSSSTEAGKLVLHVATPEGPEVEIMDLASGKWTVIKDASP